MPEVNLFYQQLEEQCGPDYIKVIRCKDCRDYDNTGYETPKFGYCRCLRLNVQDCFYCAHGEKGDQKMNEYIINPSWFYWIQVLDCVRTILFVVGSTAAMGAIFGAGCCLQQCRHRETGH